jgi:hypothetical protein
MSKTSLFSFAGSMPGISHAEIRLDIDDAGNTGSHVVDDGVSRIASPEHDGANTSRSFRFWLSSFLLLDGWKAWGGSLIPSPARQSRQQGALV